MDNATLQTRSRVLDLYFRGFPYYKIAGECGLSVRSVKNVLRLHGIIPPEVVRGTVQVSATKIDYVQKPKRRSHRCTTCKEHHTNGTTVQTH